MTPDEAARAYAEKVRAMSRSDTSGFHTAFRRCESPIEQAFCLAIFQLPGIRAVPGELDYAKLSELMSSSPTITVFAQQPIGKFRVDFLLIGTSARTAEPAFVIVECDGSEYHSAREQIRRDEERQQALQQTGFKVIRFTGSTLFRDPATVAATTLLAFVAHGWSASIVPQFVSNRRLRDALNELRDLAGNSRS